MLKCVRCNGTGKVRKNLLGECKCEDLQVKINILISLVIGSIIGIISYILLIKKFSFDYFGTIFYFLGALSIFSIISHDSFMDVLREKEILFKNIKESPVLLALILFLSFMNTKLGKCLISSDKTFINIINIIYSILQGASMLFMILIIFQILELKALVKCPLCEGNKFIEERIFNKMERCIRCSKDCGYGRKECTSKRGFCKECKGKGYNIKIY